MSPALIFNSVDNIEHILTVISSGRFTEEAVSPRLKWRI